MRRLLLPLVALLFALPTAAAAAPSLPGRLQPLKAEPVPGGVKVTSMRATKLVAGAELHVTCNAPGPGKGESCPFGRRTVVQRRAARSRNFAFLFRRRTLVVGTLITAKLEGPGGGSSSLRYEVVEQESDR